MSSPHLHVKTRQRGTPVVDALGAFVRFMSAWQPRWHKSPCVGAFCSQPRSGSLCEHLGVPTSAEPMHRLARLLLLSVLQCAYAPGGDCTGEAENAIFPVGNKGWVDELLDRGSGLPGHHAGRIGSCIPTPPRTKWGGGGLRQQLDSGVLCGSTGSRPEAVRRGRLGWTTIFRVGGGATGGRPTARLPHSRPADGEYLVMYDVQTERSLIFLI